MPFQQQLSPINMSIDALNSTKYLVVRDASSAIETATPQLKQAFNHMASEHISMADDWFRLMQSRGWYTVQQAQPQAISQTLNHLQSISSQINATSQTGYQQTGMGQQATYGQQTGYAQTGYTGQYR